jgi:hypothetical protein
MKAMKLVLSVILALLVAGAAFAQSAPPAQLAQTASPQGPVTQADLTKLDAAAAVVSQQITALKKTDPTLAGVSEKSFNEIQDDLTYLKVKLRREGAVAQKDFTDVRDRLETLRVKTQGAPGKVTSMPMIMKDEGVDKVITVPVGTQLDVRLQTALSSATAKLEQRFEATTVVDFEQAKTLVIPAGSVVRGFVSSVRPAGRTFGDRKGSITLSFDEIIIGGKRPPMRASVVQAMEGKMGDDAGRIGLGAAAGAILGGIIAGGKGALAGVLIGGGGTIAATEGANAELPPGTILRIRLDQPLEVTIVK